MTGQCHCPAGQTGEHCEEGKKNSIGDQEVLQSKKERKETKDRESFNTIK